MNLLELQDQIGQWSRENFGDQTSKATGVCLGSLAPLLGIIEELGELASVTDTCSFEDICEKGNECAHAEFVDAAADICVYLCDYCSRENVVLSDLLGKGDNNPPLIGGFNSLVSAIGELCHCTLKHHQGIRNFSDVEFYHQQRNRAIVSIWNYLNDFLGAYSTKFNCLSALEDVWIRIVSKRNWKAKPKDAHQG